MQSESFECWAIVELFGHNKIAGKVSEQTIGGSNMVRVDVPDTKAAPAFTRFLHVNAIYAINPVAQDIATGYAERIQVKPIESYDAREVLRRIDAAKQLPFGEVPSEEEQEEEDDGTNYDEALHRNRSEE